MKVIAHSKILPSRKLPFYNIVSIEDDDVEYTLITIHGKISTVNQNEFELTIEKD